VVRRNSKTYDLLKRRRISLTVGKRRKRKGWNVRLRTEENRKIKASKREKYSRSILIDLGFAYEHPYERCDRLAPAPAKSSYTFSTARKIHPRKKLWFRRARQESKSNASINQGKKFHSRFHRPRYDYDDPHQQNVRLSSAFSD
jgi:hypothetical protein